MAEWDAELVNSIVFGLGVMILAVVTVLVIIGRAVKVIARATSAENREYAALARRYEALATEVRDRLARLEAHSPQTNTSNALE